jgi:hypothetical protein
MVTTDPANHRVSMLFVEDEPDSREMLREIICHRFPDVRLLVAENGEAGLASFKRHQPDIVITDINMPIVNGIRMAAEIKSLCPSTEIIALTAYSNTQYLILAIEIGISNYILKPIDIGQFLTALEKALSIVRSKRVIAWQDYVIRDLNAELVRKTAELEAVNKELESFDYTVAHDLRSPMVTVRDLSRRLLETQAGALDDAGKGYLQVINRECVRMNCLVASLLKFSTNSQKHADKKWTGLSDIANEIRDNLLANEPGRHVTFSIAEGVSGYGDPVLLRIVFENLLGNAWKYSATKDDARIEFGTINREEDLVYFVRDNGAGFDPLESEKLFVPFQRLQCDDNVEGSGIGLATVYRIILRHGGRIWADGEKGKGTTFYFTL